MKTPCDGVMDNAAAYVALSRATCLEKLYLIEPVELQDLQHKPDADVAATLDFLSRLDVVTVATFLEDPSAFRPVTVRASVKPNDNGSAGGDNNGGGNGGGNTSPPTPAATFLPPNARNNCFMNAAIATTLAAFDGQTLPLPSSSTPSARVFFAAVGAVRQNMAAAIPQHVLVRCNTMTLR